MTPWQLLRAGRASQEALGYRLHHGPGVSVHYSTAAAGPDSSRSFCLSREKLNLQQLNRRLASYLQQVQCLEETNQRLEHQIQEELDRKCPRELSELEGHLRTASLLQDQISECLSTQAQVKLQLLSAELTVFDFKDRCEKEREHRGRLEVGLSDLRLLHEELKVHKLPELQNLLNDQTQQVMELQIQHQQDMQGLLTQVSGGVTVEMQRAETSDLIKQLDDLRDTSVMLLNKNQNKSWFNTQVSVLSSPEVTFDPLEDGQAELVELRRTAATLEEELTELQALNTLLEDSGLEQRESFVLQLAVLQQRADSLCRDLDSVLQAAAQQAPHHQTLLDTNNKLEAEIQDYKRLLHSLNREGVSSLHLNSKPTMTSFCVSTSPAASRKVMPDRVASVKGEKLWTVEVATNRGAKTEIKLQPHFVTQTTTSNPELQKATETTVLAQLDHNECYIQAMKPDPAQVISLKLETPSELARDRDEVALTPSEVSGSNCCKSEGAWSEVNLMDDKDVEREVKNEDKERIELAGASLVLDQNLALSNTSNSSHYKVEEDADKESTIATDLSSSPVSNSNLMSKTTSKDILKKTELEMNKEEVVNGFHDTSEVTVALTESVTLAGQEALLSTTESKNPHHQSSDAKELLRIMDVSMSPTKTVASLNPEICLSPVETEALVSTTDQVFCPVDLEDHIESPDSPLKPNDPEMYLSLNVSDTHLSPVETKESSSPNGEEEEDETCLSLTEANAHVRPVEKYVLSTKEEGQSLSFSEEQALPEEDRNKKVTSSVTDGESLCFGAFKDKGRIRGIDDTNINARPTSKVSDLQLSSSLGGPEEGPTDTYNDMSSTSNNKDIKSLSGSPRTQDGSEDQEETANMGSSVASNSGGMPASNSAMASDLAARFSCTAANSSGTVSSNTDAAAKAGIQGRFSRGSGEWMVYGGSLGHAKMSVPSTGSEESPSVAKDPVTSQTETGRFGSRGSGEWMVYGGSLRRKSSLDAGTGLPSERNMDNLSVATDPVTIPPETGRFSSRGSGEWMVYGGSLRRKSSLDAGTGLLSEGNKGNLSVATDPVTSPPETGRFGSRGSGEWMVYGGSLRRTSSVAGSESLPKTENDESLLTAMNLATGPPEKGRFGSGGSGEWRIYSGSAGHLSSVGSADRISTNDGQVISPPSSYRSSGPKLSSAGSGGRLTSSSVRRSSSVGSGGKLRISSSGRLASTGSGEWKPVYSSASGRRSSVGSSGSQRAPSPGGRVSVSGGSGGWLNTSTAGANRMSSAGSGSKLSGPGSNDRISSRAGGRISSSSGSGRTNSMGGRVISSSDWPIRSTGSGAGSNKERISVCKMAALSISAAGRERSQERRRQAQRNQQQQQAAASSPLLQRWLNTGVGVMSADPDLDDIMRL